MKIYSKLFSIALAGLMLGSCSSEDVVDNGKGGGASWNSDGTGYVNLAIKLPTTPASRGVNDVTDDGVADEYAVKNATLILFNGENEATAKINSAYEINPNFSLSGDGQITTTANVTKQINSIAGTDNIYALVVLNHQGLMSVEEANADLKVNNVSMKDNNISQLNDAVKALIGTNYSWNSATTGFLMSNAVLTEEVGGAVGTAPAGNVAAIQTLSKIDRAKIHPTEAEATADPAAIIYVERAEAKVTVLDAVTDKTVTDGSGHEYTIGGWVLDNTNKSNKLIRTVDGYATWAAFSTNAPNSTNYRFTGNTLVGKNILGENLYRVYWGDDYNYSTFGTKAAELTFIPDGTVPATFNTIGTSAYCFENTTDVDRMREDKCTRVIVKATFNEGNPFFIIDNDVKDMFSVEDAKKEAAARIVADNDVNKWLETNLADGKEINSATDINVELNTLSAGKVTVKSVTLTEGAKAKFKEGVNTDPEVQKWAAVANSHINLEYYDGGAAYYPVYVAHFGEDLTPWDKGETDAPSASSIYPAANRDKNYLGRWGVLRNNWYQINVTSIRSIGAPTVEEVNGTIDKKESYISVTVNTLPWAVRTQNAEL